MPIRAFNFLLSGVLLAVVPLHAQSVDGVWRSRGYGDVYEIQGPTVKTYQVTSTTCVPGFTAQRDPAPVPGREATFTHDGSEVFFIRAGGKSDHKLLHNEGSASDVRLDRVPRLPTVCDHPTPNTPAGNFEVFSRTWAENYIMFDQKKVDWAEVVRANQSKVRPETTPAELYDILAGMIEPLHDRHTFIEAPDLKRDFSTYRPGTDRIIKGNIKEFRSKTMPALWEITDRTYVKTPMRKFCREKLQYGHINATTGYLRIFTFYGYADTPTFAAGLTALESALDEIFSDPNLKALVIDVRINFGGADPYGLAIASRLATRPYVAYTKVARADPVDRNKWTSGDPSDVSPSTRPSFHGPVVELTGPMTISAGETFTQALMGRTPHVLRIGENTQGVFSDVLGRNLPNGWQFGLPNEVFRTAQGTTFDGPGIPPDIIVPVYADDDVAAGKDPAMAKAIETLGRMETLEQKE
jgi:hypothetical protein